MIRNAMPRPFPPIWRTARPTTWKSSCAEGTTITSGCEPGGAEAAGGGVYRTLQGEPESLANQLKVIFETPPMPPHPLSAHPRVPLELRRRMQEAVLKLAETEEGRAMLASVRIKNPVIAEFERDYRSIVGLGTAMYAFLLQ
jgi:phosphonate transport system substrate-binding protein